MYCECHADIVIGRADDGSHCGWQAIAAVAPVLAGCCKGTLAPGLAGCCELGLSTLAPVDWDKVSRLGMQHADLNDGDGLLGLLFIASYVGCCEYRVGVS